MSNYAVLNGNQVTNVIVADDKEDAEKVLGVTLIEYTDENPIEIGWTYDETTGLFSPPQ
jgi:hypothetical protein